MYNILFDSFYLHKIIQYDAIHYQNTKYNASPLSVKLMHLLFGNKAINSSILHTLKLQNKQDQSFKGRWMAVFARLLIGIPRYLAPGDMLGQLMKSGSSRHASLTLISLPIKWTLAILKGYIGL